MDTWQPLWTADDSIRETYGQMDALFAAKHPDGFGPDDVVFPTDNWDDLSTINYTSGSTGDPKGVMLTYRNFSANVDYSQRNVPAGDKMVSMLPMAHMYGLVIEFIYPLCNGTSIYWLGKAPTPAALLKAFADVKPYLLITVPLVMEKIYKSKVKPTLDKPVVKFLSKVPLVNNLIYKKVKDGLVQAFGGNVQEFIMGGAALNPEVERLFKRIKFPYLVGYGMTEACPLLAYEHWTKYVAGSCGKCVDVAEVRIDSEDPQHVVGEIQARGENIMIGYYKNPEATANAFTEDGWLRTGDIGEVSDSGELFITGRLKNLIILSNGENVSPEAIEKKFADYDIVSEVLVYSENDRITADIYPDFGYCSDNDIDDPKDVITAIVKQMNEGAKPSHVITQVRVVNEPLPRTPTGKLLRKKAEI